MKTHTASKNSSPKIQYVSLNQSTQLPILDITHPLFISNADEKVYTSSLSQSEHLLQVLKRMPRFVQTLFKETSGVDDSYLNGMRTLIYKLGPDLTKGCRLNLRDKWAVNQGTFMGLRLRLQEICRRQAEILIPQLKAAPQKNLCFINIGGGNSSDSLNTLFLVQDEAPELLKGRKIEIDILDLDTFGPAYAKKCVEALKMPGSRFNGLDISLRVVAYDWTRPEALAQLLPEKADWIQMCSSEGGLFEYGSDEDIQRNLDQLSIYAARDIHIAGSLIYDKAHANPGYLGFAEFTGINIQFRGMDGLNQILAQTQWMVEAAKGIGDVFMVFTLRKRDTE